MVCVYSFLFVLFNSVFVRNLTMKPLKTQNSTNKLGAILYKNESLKLSLNTKSNLGEEKSGNSYFCTILRLLVVEIQQIRLHKVRTQYDRFFYFCSPTWKMPKKWCLRKKYRYCELLDYIFKSKTIPQWYIIFLMHV